VKTLFKQQIGCEIGFDKPSFVLQLRLLYSICDYGTELVGGGFPTGNVTRLNFIVGMREM
jgi:hypothetical protein